MPISIRDFQKSDFETLWRIDQQCFAPGISYTRLELASYIQLAGSFTLVAESKPDGSALAEETVAQPPALPNPDTQKNSKAPHNPDILGFVVANANRYGSGHIITIDVIPTTQRSGVGSDLLRGSENRLRDAKCSFVRLETAVNNLPALAFYKRHGYFLTRTIRRYYPDGTDALVLKKNLPPAPAER